MSAVPADFSDAPLPSDPVDPRGAPEPDFDDAETDLLDSDDEAEPVPTSDSCAAADPSTEPLVLAAAAPVEITVESRAHGWRIDHYLARLFPNFSRALFQRAIAQHAVCVNGLPVKSSRRLRVNDRLSVRLPEQSDGDLLAEDIPLSILYEDDFLVVLDKPPRMITHPGKGNWRGTLASALQFHFDRLSDAAGRLRPGIVHRLDRDTSGVLVVAKDNQVHHRLSGQFERREVRKEYRAIVWGAFAEDSGTIETHLRIHPVRREKMQVCEPSASSRSAVTRFEVLERFPGFSSMRLLPHTGRTHQLRVHMAHRGHPIVADHLYGGRESLCSGELRRRREELPRSQRIVRPEDAPADLLIDRQALHAFRLEFAHPQSGKRMTFEAPLPVDFLRTLEALAALGVSPA